MVVKLAYQSGFEAPLTVTLLYLSGQGLSIVVYWVQQTFFTPAPAHARIDAVRTSCIRLSDKEEEDDDDDESPQDHHLNLHRHRHRHPPTKDTFVEDDRRYKANGSTHGLTHRSREAVKWIHLIPWYSKPIIPAIFNVLNSALRWVSLIYIAASLSEMLIAGTELILSVVVARIFRKRLVSISRWFGIIVIAFGVTLISILSYVTADDEQSDNGDNDKEEQEHHVKQSSPTSHSKEDVAIGIALIVAQCIFSALQDVSEEVFMQEANFPPMLLLGMEGCFGFVLGLILFLIFGEQMGEDPRDTFALLDDQPSMYGWIMSLPVLFLVTGIFNIKATEVTSSMTRNVWKNVRTLLVWVITLIIYYTSGDIDIGEAWIFPTSLYRLIGFVIMSAGILTYYWNKEREVRKEMNTTNIEMSAYDSILSNAENKNENGRTKSKKNRKKKKILKEEHLSIMEEASRDKEESGEFI